MLSYNRNCNIIDVIAFEIYVVVVIIILVANVDVSLDFWVGVIRHPHNNTRI